MAKMAMALMWAVVGVLVVAAAAQMPQCNNYLNLANCLQAVNTNSGYPGAACCNTIRSYNGYANCLCQTMNSAQNSGIRFNLRNALTIPRRCGFAQYIPPNYKCDGIPV